MTKVNSLKNSKIKDEKMLFSVITRIGVCKDGVILRIDGETDTVYIKLTPYMMATIVDVSRECEAMKNLPEASSAGDGEDQMGSN